MARPVARRPPPAARNDVEVIGRYHDHVGGSDPPTRHRQIFLLAPLLLPGDENKVIRTRKTAMPREDALALLLNFLAWPQRHCTDMCSKWCMDRRAISE